MDTMPTPPGPGDVLRLGRAASVQFDGDRALTAEVIGVPYRSLFEDWMWLEVLVLDPPEPAGTAVREVFVRRAAVCSGPTERARRAPAEQPGSGPRAARDR